jgi:hypothetical protein
MDAHPAQLVIDLYKHASKIRDKVCESKDNIMDYTCQVQKFIQEWRDGHILFLVDTSYKVVVASRKVVPYAAIKGLIV